MSVSCANSSSSKLIISGSSPLKLSYSSLECKMRCLKNCSSPGSICLEAIRNTPKVAPKVSLFVCMYKLEIPLLWIQHQYVRPFCFFPVNIGTVNYYCIWYDSFSSTIKCQSVIDPQGDYYWCLRQCPKAKKRQKKTGNFFVNVAKKLLFIF